MIGDANPKLMGKVSFRAKSESFSETEPSYAESGDDGPYADKKASKKKKIKQDRCSQIKPKSRKDP